MSLQRNIEQIKENAPSGATHYSRQIERYFKYNGWLLEHGLPPKDTTPIGQKDYGC